MNVLLFTLEDPLYLPRYLEPILESRGDRLSGIVVAPPKASLATQLGEQLRMLGPAGFVRMGARYASGKLLAGLPFGLDRRCSGRYRSVASVARAYGVPIERVSDVNRPAFVASVEERDVDVILSVVCGQRLGVDLLAVPEWAINVHGSLLPKYRGRATAFWPLYYGDDESGVTAHLMTERFDAGPILDQRPFSIEPADTMHDVYLKIAATGGDLVVDLLDELDEAAPEPRPNSTTPADYHTLPTAAERRRFEARGNEFV